MPAVDTVLLPLCVGLALLGVIFTGLAWRRSNKGRVIQGVALALAPIALYLSGLLRLLWNGVVAVGTWVSGVVFSTTVWFGLGLLGLCVALWVVGALVAKRHPGRSSKKVASTQAPHLTAVTRASASRPAARPVSGKSNPKAAVKAPVDDDMAEIEALLKSRGIS